MAAKRNLAVRVWAGIGLVLALFLAWAIAPRPAQVETARIDRGPVQVSVIDEGRTRVHDVFLVSAPLSGVLRRVEVEPGDAVAKGAIVARIAPERPALLDARARREIRAEIDAARALMRAAEAQTNLAAENHRRTAILAAKNLAAQAALDRDAAALRAAEANFASSKARLRQAEAALTSPNDAGAATPVRAPAAGKVLRVLQESETSVMAGAPILEIGDPHADLEIVAEFLSQDAVRMRPGMPGFIENWGGSAPLSARIIRIEPYARTKISALGVEEQRVNVILNLAPEAKKSGLGHGFRVDARVILAQTDNSVRAPTDALVRRGADWAAFKIVKGKARLTPLTLGEGDARYRPALSGLQPGDLVILFPQDTLKDGARVKARR